MRKLKNKIVILIAVFLILSLYLGALPCSAAVTEVYVGGMPAGFTLGMGGAQVTAGGIATAEFCPETMESRKIPGLYAAGEVLDIDGDCGGFNLQWAWSSAHAAASAIARSL